MNHDEARLQGLRSKCNVNPLHVHFVTIRTGQKGEIKTVIYHYLCARFPRVMAFNLPKKNVIANKFKVERVRNGGV